MSEMMPETTTWRRATFPPRAFFSAVAQRGAGMAAAVALWLWCSGGAVMAAEVPNPSELAYREGKAAKKDSEARVHYQHGIDSARGILSTSPDQPGALLWLAANLAGEALTHGRLFALRVIPQIESSLLRLE
ncbi:MAG: hypothetical protein ABIS92_12885, partial [Polyangia bacterium]